MNALHPNNIDIKDQDIKFNIPIYQRLFTWGIEQIELLLNDLLYQAMGSPHNNYYIGVLTVTNNTPLQRLDLVDGQQRFTVMVLMGIIMRRYFNNWKNFVIANDEKMRLDFSARPDDHNYLKSFILKENTSDVDSLLDDAPSLKYENDTMKKGLLFIRDYMENIDKKCNDVMGKKEGLPEDLKISREKFAEYIFNHLSFFIQKLPDDYTPRMLNKHFESMNSTGRNLENHEILKVKLLENVKPEEYPRLVALWNRASRMNEIMFPVYDDNKRKEYINKLYTLINKSKEFDYDIEQTDDQNHSNKIPDIAEIISSEVRPVFQNDNNTDNNIVTYRSFIRFTDFLLQVLFTLMGKEKQKNVNKQQFFNPNNLLDTCDQYVGVGEEKISEADFIEAVFLYRIIFDYYILRIDGNGSYRLTSAGNEEHNKLEQYQAMLYVNSSRNTYYQWIPFILHYVKTNCINCPDEKKFNDDMLLELKKVDSEIDEHKREQLGDNPSYKSFGNYFFRRLDYYLWECFVDNKNIDSLFPPGTTSIDDILKKTVKDYKFHQYDWVEHLEPQNENKQTKPWDCKTYIDSFGNLALISDTFNIIQGNDPLGWKFARIKEQIDQVKDNKLESIKLAIMFYTANKEAAKWTPTLMQEHEEIMIEVLEESYQK